MIREQDPQNALEFISIEELVPSDHLLRKISRHIEFEFIREKTKKYYSTKRGRPAIDPVVLFKAMFLGYLFGIRSERRLVQEIQVNAAYRWFLGLKLTDKVMDHSTFSQNRRRRFKESDIFKEIFDEIVSQAIKKGLVGGEILYTDSTHIKANANKKKYKKRTIKKSTKKYMDELEKAINEDRKNHGKKPLPPKEGKEEEKEIYESSTDPESGNMIREGKPKGFFYLDHRTTDDKYNIIVDTFVTAANVNDAEPYIERLNYLIEKYGWEIKTVGLDAGYFTPWICKNMLDKGIFGAIAYRKPTSKKGYIKKRFYVYDSEKDCIVCPANHELQYSTTNREGRKEYHSDPKVCKNCELLSQCTQSKNHQKVVSRHVWEESKEKIIEYRKSEKGKAIISRRKEKIEISFANGKRLHNHTEAMRRGIKNVQEQAYLSAACQNMKSIALFLFILLRILKNYFIEPLKIENNPFSANYFTSRTLLA